jgi:putative oxidoreductase
MVKRIDDAALLGGRVLMTALFLPSGFLKLLDFPGFVASLGTKGLPMPLGWAIVAVGIEVLAPIALAVGFAPRATALILLMFLMMATATSHRFWELEGAARRLQESHFSHNLGLLGGLCFYFASGPGAWAWRGPRAARGPKDDARASRDRAA